MTSAKLSLTQLRSIEEKAKAIGLDEKTLIENASSNLYSAIDGLKLGKKTVVISGRGNNGADVLCCARKLASRGYNIRVIILKEKELGFQALIQKDILEKLNIPIHCIEPQNIQQLKEYLNDCDFILEGILGIGIKGAVSKFLGTAINLINSSNKVIVSCDIPSGLSPDEGVALGTAIKANYTISFIAAKQGFFLNQGRLLCGKVIIADIGVSKEILESIGTREGT